jgi:hypothetical protein
MDIRKQVILTEQILSDAKRPLERPVTRVAAIAVITNPFASRFVKDLTELMDIGEQLGALLGEQAAAALPGGAVSAEGYGKGAIVGMEGELEHAAAILHPKLGKPFREALGGGKAIIPSTKKMGAPGTALDVPTHFKDAAFVRSHFDAIEIRVQDAPRKEEIVVALVVTDGGRPHPRVGGLRKVDAQMEDGLR